MELSIDYDERYYESSYGPTIGQKQKHRYNVTITIHSNDQGN